MSLSYAWEKLHLAVRHLSRNPATIQRRVAAAWAHYLIRLTLTKDVPESASEDFEFIRTTMTKIDPVGDESLENAAERCLSSEEASQIAERIVGLYDEVARMLGAEDHRIRPEGVRRTLPPTPSIN